MPDLPFLDSFDHYLTADGVQKWSSGVTISAGNGRRGTAGARVESSGISKTFNSEYAILYAGGAFKGPGNAVFKFANVLSNVSVSLMCASDGRLYTSGNDPTNNVWFPPQLWFGFTPPLLSDRWYYIEMKAEISGSGISVIVRINEEVVLTESVSFVGVLHTHASWATVNIQGRGGGASTYVDDVYVDAIGFYGDVNIDVIRPDGPATSMWIPSPLVANWLNVKDIAPDGNTTTVSSTLVNDLDLYTMEDIPSNAIVKAIQGIASVKKDTAGLASLKLQYGASGGGEFFSDEFYPSETSYIMLRDGRKDILTPGAINGLIFGPKRIK
jgi:hypothetical protein